MTHSRREELRKIEIEFNKEDELECHSCGKIKKRNYLIHLRYLCQHYVFLCPKCFKVLAQQIHDRQEGR